MNCENHFNNNIKTHDLQYGCFCDDKTAIPTTKDKERLDTKGS